MINIRLGLFETNSSSTNSFSHKNNAYVLGNMEFTVKVHSDIMDEEKEQHLCDYITKWLVEMDYAKNTKLVSIKKVSTKDNYTTYLLSIDAEYYLTLTIYVTEYYETHGYSDPDEYWVQSLSSKLNKKDDSYLNSLNEYIDNNALDIEFKVVSFTKDNISFTKDELNKHLFEDNNDYWE